MLINDESSAAEDETFDISEEHYTTLLSSFRSLGESIQRNIKNQILTQRKIRISKYNQHLLLRLPKHILVKVKSRISAVSINLGLNQHFNILDIESKNHFNYTTQSNVSITAFDVIDVAINASTTVITLESDKSVTLNDNTIDIWVNPDLWSYAGYKLSHLKDSLLQCNGCIIRAYTSKNEYTTCKGHFEDGLSYALNENDNSLFKLSSPEYCLGLKIVFDELPQFLTETPIGIIEIEFVLEQREITSISESISNIKELYKTNIVPLFNVYEGYSSRQTLDIKYEEIPLINAEDAKSKPFYVNKLWINNIEHADYCNPVESECIFHKQTGMLIYSPKERKKAIKEVRSFYAKVLWTQDAEHGNQLNISTNAIAASHLRLELLNIKSAKTNMPSDSLEDIVELFKSFTDLDIRKPKDFMFALKYICGDNNTDIYQEYNASTLSLEYTAYNNTLNIQVAHQSQKEFVYYISKVLAEFFHANTPQVINLLVSVYRIA